MRNNRGLIFFDLVLIVAAFLVMLALPVLAYPQRIVSGLPSVTEMLYALDLGDRVVGVTSNCNYPPAARKKEKIGGFFLNLEKVVSLKPDLVIMVEEAQKRDIEKFKNYGLPVYTINPRSVADVMGTLIQLGKLTGKERVAASLVARMKSRLAALQPRSFSLELILKKRPKVLAIVGNNPLIVVGGGTFIDDIMKQAGAENVAGSSRAAYPQYSFENLMKENPEYLIVPRGVMAEKELFRDPRWRQLSAVKERKILMIDADILSRPGPRVIDAVEEIAHFIYGKKN
ncbi:MAG: cobalamin-binding protein [Candidatus Margulisbacteria bacterium]|nr:cobalamin-binding protein [Candidatus Margulisiibacteriota bacterium]